MKHQALFPWKDKSKNIKCRLLQFLFGALRVKNLGNKSPKLQVGVNRNILSNLNSVERMAYSVRNSVVWG